MVSNKKMTTLPMNQTEYVPILENITNESCYEGSTESDINDFEQ